MFIKKGDTVKILKGKDKGKTGKVTHVYIEDSKVVVDGLNLFKKHVRPKQQGEKGQTVQIARPMRSANVGLVCTSCNRAVRVGHRFDGDKKIRFCRKCGSIV